MQEGLSVTNLANPAPIHDEQHQRLEVKLRRELGEQVLSCSPTTAPKTSF
jgi:hypothetical protein